MRAITVRQPWARCIAIGRKNIENRARPTAYRGLVAIHAGKTPAYQADHDPRVTALFGEDPRLGAPMGAIIAVAELTDCHQASPTRPTCCQPWGDSDYLGKPAWHLVLTNARPVQPPVPAVGKLSVPWTLPDDIAAQIEQRLTEAHHA